MDTIQITDRKNPLFGTFMKIYSSSFPVFEQRTDIQQDKAFDDIHYHLAAYLDSNACCSVESDKTCSTGDRNFAGFISYWEFDGYIYIEHFAVNNTIRGKGYGSKILDSFITAHLPKRIVLEIDPLEDEISRARLRFYERCGFSANAYVHRHPPYRSGCTPHPLIVLSTNGEISETGYKRFSKDLSDIVMNGRCQKP